MKKREEKAKRGPGKGKETRTYRCHCPFCVFMEGLSSERRKHHEFWEHLDNAQVELLEGIRALIDHKIERIRRRGQESDEDLTRIEIDGED